MDLRLLASDDAARLERFLGRHRDSSMFLRANSRRAGLVYRGEPFQADYFAAVTGDEVVGVVAHAWSGMLLVQAPDHVDELTRRCVQVSGRKVSGLQGPRDQVKRARSALSLDDVPATLNGDDGLFVLSLSDVLVPSPLSTGAVTCRAPRDDEYPTLHAWRVAYDIEALGSPDTVETRKRAAGFLEMQLAAGNAWVALAGDRLLSLSAFNAALPDIVQLGGIYTPPELRNRGYAKAAVAHSLLVAQGRGVSRAVLFAKEPSAIRCYQALGFRRVGDYGLVLFA